MTDHNGHRVAMVTGATGWLGRALVPLLARRGYQIAGTYIIPEEAERLETELQAYEDVLHLRRVDVTDPEAINDFVKETVETLGGLHVLCCLVGGWAGGRDVEETDDVRLERMLDLNLRSAFYTVRAAIPHLRAAGWGRVVLVGSRAAVDTPMGQAAYNVAKAGVIALGSSIAQELDGSGVTANVVMPSVIDTPATREAMPYADFVDWPSPDEVADVLDLLVSDASGIINGASIPL